jgi:hypothetical protein
MGRKPSALRLNWVSLSRLARILGEPLSKVRSARDEGKISGLMFGKDFYVYRDEVERLLTEKEGGGYNLPPSLLRDKGLRS